MPLGRGDSVGQNDVVENGIIKKSGDSLLNCEVLAAWNGILYPRGMSTSYINIKGPKLGALGFNSHSHYSKRKECQDQIPSLISKHNHANRIEYFCQDLIPEMTPSS